MHIKKMFLIGFEINSHSLINLLNFRSYVTILVRCLSDSFSYFADNHLLVQPLVNVLKTI